MASEIVIEQSTLERIAVAAIEADGDVRAVAARLNVAEVIALHAVVAVRGYFQSRSWTRPPFDHIPLRWDFESVDHVMLFQLLYCHSSYSTEELSTLLGLSKSRMRATAKTLFGSARQRGRGHMNPARRAMTQEVYQHLNDAVAHIARMLDFDHVLVSAPSMPSVPTASACTPSRFRRILSYISSRILRVRR